MSANQNEKNMVANALSSLENNKELADKKRQMSLRLLEETASKTGVVELEESELNETEQKVNVVFDQMFKSDLTSLSVQEGLQMGLTDMNRKTMEHARTFTSAKLDARMGDLQGTEEGNALFDEMMSLNTTLKEIHPSNFDLAENFFAKFLPFTSPVRKYFDKFRTTKSVIDETRIKLERSIEQQRTDIKILKQDKRSLQEIAVSLKKAIEFNTKLKERIEEELARNLDMDDSAREFIEAHILFNITREVQGLQELLTVNMQGQQSFEMLMRSGTDLIDSAERCINVSVNALTIAAVIAHVVAGQKKMLEGIKAVNKTAENAISWNAQQMNTNIKEIGRQAVETNLDINVLVKAIDMSVDAIQEDIQFRRDSLPTMNENVKTLSEATSRAEKSAIELESARIQRENFDQQAKDIFNI